MKKIQNFKQFMALVHVRLNNEDSVLSKMQVIRQNVSLLYCVFSGIDGRMLDHITDLRDIVKSIDLMIPNIFIKQSQIRGMLDSMEICLCEISIQTKNKEVHK